MLKSLEVGKQDLQIAFTAVTMLEEWINSLPMHVTVEMYRGVLPKLSGYLEIEKNITGKKNSK